jgi:hypothetical protein
MSKDTTMEKGQKRMLHIKIWQNEGFATMSAEARLIYIGLIILADDDGKLKGNSTLLRSQIFPFDEKMSLEKFKFLLKEVKKSKLIDIYCVNNEYFICHPNWNRYQYIRKDLYKPSIYPDNPLQSRNVSVTETLPKKRKEKERKEKISKTKVSKNTFSEFENVLLSVEEHKKLIERLGESNTGVLIEELGGFIASTKKRYANHYATLLNWARRRVQKHQEKLQIKGRTIA